MGIELVVCYDLLFRAQIDSRVFSAHSSILKYVTLYIYNKIISPALIMKTKYNFTNSPALVIFQDLINF